MTEFFNFFRIGNMKDQRIVLRTAFGFKNLSYSIFV